MAAEGIDQKLGGVIYLGAFVVFTNKLGSVIMFEFNL